MDLTHHSTVDDVIDALGGTKVVAEITGKKANVVSNWRTRKHFPAPTFLVITSALASKGATAPISLWKMTEENAA